MLVVGVLQHPTIEQIDACCSKHCSDKCCSIAHLPSPTAAMQSAPAAMNPQAAAAASAAAASAAAAANPLAADSSGGGGDHIAKTGGGGSGCGVVRTIVKNGGGGGGGVWKSRTQSLCRLVRSGQRFEAERAAMLFLN